MKRPLAKRRTLLEHQGLWLASALLFGLVTAGAMLIIDSGALADYAFFPPILRGYTFTGLLFAVTSVALGCLTFLYSLRKRSLQEKMPVGTMAGWLWGHVYLGVCCLIAAVAHAGWGSVGLEFSLGKGLLALLVVLVVSGLLWRLLYSTLPPKAATEVGHYSQSASRARAATAQVEIEKLSAGCSPALQQLVTWLMNVNASDPEIAQASRSIPNSEQVLVSELVRLTRTRRAALKREERQGRYRRLLQGTRILHVPVSVLFLLLLPLHVLWAFDVPAKIAGPTGMLGGTFGGFHPSENCSSCHERIVKEWQSSMHGHALTSPIMVAQNNLAHRETLANTSSPDPQNVCVNCHGPLATALSQSPVLPFKSDQPLAEPALLSEGITCSVCHQWQGDPVTAGAGLTAFQKGLEPGHTFYGPYDDAAGNAYHQSKSSPLFKNGSELCRNCHSVQYDRNGDGKIERGTDLVLQTLYDEWADYAKAGSGAPTCVDCHMPTVAGTRAAESALLPLEQDSDAPNRTLRSHHFVAGDYPLDDTRARDASRAEREALLKRAVTLAFSATPRATDTTVSFDVSITNAGTGHNFPGGFGFVRQMWLEVTVLNPQGQVMAGSGIVRSPVNDLCDASILDDATNPMRSFVVGCSAGSDKQLVNLQQMLLDKVELLRDAGGNVQLDARGQAKLRAAPGAQEVVVQYITSGPVPRVRPATGKPTPPLVAGEARVFPYTLDLPSGVSPAGVSKVRVRLLFRPSPPYFLRALAKTQTAQDGINLAGLVENLEILEMARTEAILQR